MWPFNKKKRITKPEEPEKPLVGVTIANESSTGQAAKIMAEFLRLGAKPEHSSEADLVLRSGTNNSTFLVDRLGTPLNVFSFSPFNLFSSLLNQKYDDDDDAIKRWVKDSSEMILNSGVGQVKIDLSNL